jgi:DNA-binding HxlR family transcriptional regulator
MVDETVADGLVLTGLDRGAATGRAISSQAGRGVTIHCTLRRLERDGLVRSVPVRGARRPQRLYRLTAAGEEALLAWRLVLRTLARA